MVSLVTRRRAPVPASQKVMGELNGTKISNTSSGGFGRRELVYPDDDYALEREVITNRN
jgi:hypothetical protein